MKTNKINIILTILAVISITGCQKEEIPYYDEGYNSVRFPVSSLSVKEVTGYDASTALFHAGYSFISYPFAEYAIYDIPMVLMGTRTDHDRKINYTAHSDKSTAPAGSYEILDSKIPADSIAGYIRIKLYNVDALNEEVYELYLSLAESEGLSPAPSKYTNAVLTWHNSLPAPTLNTQIRTYNYMIDSPAPYNSLTLPYFSPNALKAIVDAFSWDDWDDYDVHGSNFNDNGYPYLPRSTVLSTNSRYKSYAEKLGAYIKTYNEIHLDSPLRHNAGEQKGELIKARIYDN